MLKNTYPTRFDVTVKTLATLLVAGLLATGSAWAGESESFSQTYPLAADGRLSLENLNGDVTIEGWSGNEVQIDYLKTSRTREGLERVEVVIEARGDHIHLETDYSNSRGWSNDGANVDFTIRVPQQARLDEIELVNGNLTISAVSGNVNASLVNGRVDAQDLSGSLSLESVNGTVEVTFETLGDGQSVDLESVNGSVVLRLPSDADAEIEAETVHGPIDNEFGLEVIKGRYVGRSMEGTLGNGSARVDLENVNGSIRIEQN